MGEGGRVRVVETFAGQRAGRSEFHARRLARDVSQGSDEASINFVTDDRIQVGFSLLLSLLQQGTNIFRGD